MWSRTRATAASTSRRSHRRRRSCAGSNKDVQEFTAGYWYNFYNGPKGRLRQGIQYSYMVRNLWSGVGGAANPANSAEGTDNMVFTSFRYYLP